MFVSLPKVEAEKENVGQETPPTKSNVENVEKKTTKAFTLEKPMIFTKEVNNTVINSEEEIRIVSYGTI